MELNKLDGWSLPACSTEKSIVKLLMFYLYVQTNTMNPPKTSLSTTQLSLSTQLLLYQEEKKRQLHTDIGT